jgi:hypothetical protein
MWQQAKYGTDSNALHEKAMKANGKGVDVQSYDVWLVDSEKDRIDDANNDKKK